MFAKKPLAHHLNQKQSLLATDCCEDLFQEVAVCLHLLCTLLSKTHFSIHCGCSASWDVRILTLD